MLTFAMAHPFITLFVLFLLMCLVDVMWKSGKPPEHCDSLGNYDDK